MALYVMCTYYTSIGFAVSADIVGLTVAVVNSVARPSILALLSASSSYMYVHTDTYMYVEAGRGYI